MIEVLRLTEAGFERIEVCQTLNKIIQAHATDCNTIMTKRLRGGTRGLTAG